MKMKKAVVVLVLDWKTTDANEGRRATKELLDFLTEPVKGGAIGGLKGSKIRYDIPYWD